MSPLAITLTIIGFIIALTAFGIKLSFKLLEIEQTIWKITAVISSFIISAFIVLVIFRATFVDFVDNYEIGYMYDARTGQTTILPRQGYFVTKPIVIKIHAVDLRPVQVCINANQRVLNCKLVQFNKEGLMLFLSWHGRADYSIGDSTGQSTTPTTFVEILKSYAYDGNERSYPFLRVNQEVKPTSSGIEKATTKS